jgi:hypothetical protein
VTRVGAILQADHGQRRLMRCLIPTVALAVAMTLAPAASAEDVCAPNAPQQSSEVQGLTWSGTVVAVQQTGVTDEGVEQWTITIDVDHVYAHLPGHDFPATAVLAPGARLNLPSDNCGRDGDMHLRVGGRYLVSTAFIDQGTSIANLVAWELDGLAVRLVPGLFKTSFVAPEFVNVTSLQEALQLLGIDAPPDTAAPTLVPSPSLAPSGIPPGEGAMPPATWALIGLGILAVALGSLAWSRSTRRRGG